MLQPTKTTTMQNQTLNFNENFYAATTLEALESKGWEFGDFYQDIAAAKGLAIEDAEKEAKENTDVALRSNEDGDIFFSFLDNEGNESHPQLSGDEPKSRIDIKELYDEELLWNVENV